MPDFGSDGVTLRFADQLRGISVSSLLSNIGTFHVLVSPGGHGEFFYCSGHDFSFRLWLEGDTVCLLRNGRLATRKINFPDQPTHVAISWKPDTIQLAVFADREVASDEVHQTIDLIQPFYVPNTLVTWAREQHKLPYRTFSSAAEALAVLMEAVRQIRQRIHDSNMYSLFWDYPRGGKIHATPLPKREPQALGGLMGMLQDDSVLKGYSIILEGRASGGNLDAQIVVSLRGGEQVKFALEGKSAHSDDIEHGLRQQLPEYMRAIDAVHGIYLVLWYSGNLFDKPERSQTDFSLRLMHLRPTENILVEIFDLSKPLPPSDRRFEYI